MYFTFDKNGAWEKRISAALARRGLVPVPEAEWEKHGPHEGMPFMVYIGYARPARKEFETVSRSWPLEVVVYPRAVYHLGNAGHWSVVGPRDRVRTVTKRPSS